MVRRTADGDHRAPGRAGSFAVSSKGPTLEYLPPVYPAVTQDHVREPRGTLGSFLEKFEFPGPRHWRNMWSDPYP